jgi:serine/threonine protein kinase
MDEEVNLINKVLQENTYHAEVKLSEGSYGEIFKVVNRETKKIYAMKAL